MWVSEYVSIPAAAGGASLYRVWTSTLRWGGLKGDKDLPAVPTPSGRSLICTAFQALAKPERVNAWGALIGYKLRGSLIVLHIRFGPLLVGNQS